VVVNVVKVEVWVDVSKVLEMEMGTKSEAGFRSEKLAEEGPDSFSASA
jgi:hypothetical protein